jgi:hypothetical protein
MLAATVDGRLTDGVGWMIRTPPVKDIGLEGRYLILGRRSDARWSTVVDPNCHDLRGDWTVPEPLTLDLAGDRTHVDSYAKATSVDSRKPAASPPIVNPDDTGTRTVRVYRLHRPPRPATS